MPETSRGDETRYRVFKILEADPQISQRGLAESLGISLGKANYCLRELVKNGFVKISNFKNSQNKRAYLYYLTPSGIEEKAKVTYRFLRHKIQEFEALKVEIAQLDHGEQSSVVPALSGTSES